MKLKRTALAAVGLAAAAAVTVLPANPAMAGTGPGVHYYANDVTGNRFGPPLTGTAVQAIAQATARWQHDPAELAQVAAFEGYPLPGSPAWLLAHPGRWHAAAAGLGDFLDAHLAEEVRWTSPYRTQEAIPHGTQPTGFQWVSEPDLTRDVLVFTNGRDLVMNCGGQPYIPVRPVPLPSRPRQVKGCGGFVSCAPCPAGERMAGGGGQVVCQPPCAVRVYVVTAVQAAGATVITVVTITSSGGGTVVVVEVVVVVAGQCTCS